MSMCVCVCMFIGAGDAELGSCYLHALLVAIMCKLPDTLGGRGAAQHSEWCECRDAPAPSQPKLLPVPVGSINFAQQHAGSFVFGGGSEPSSNGGGAGSATMAMES